jgi:hypothetical protein
MQGTPPDIGGARKEIAKLRRRSEVTKPEQNRPHRSGGAPRPAADRLFSRRLRHGNMQIEIRRAGAGCG